MLAPLIDNGEITADLATHIKPDGKYRDHGLLFKILPQNIRDLLSDEKTYDLSKYLKLENKAGTQENVLYSCYERRRYCRQLKYFDISSLSQIYSLTQVVSCGIPNPRYPLILNSTSLTFKIV